MEPAEYVAALESEGKLLADNAAAIDPSTPVPTCPDWTLRDLIRHIGGVHRWAGEHVRDQWTSVLDVDDFRDIVGEWPSDADLVNWYRCEHRRLVEVLRSAPLDVTCAAFLKSASPLAFWARRQAHEAAIHRADVELIRGVLTPAQPRFAADGIDELVDGFVPRPFMKLRSPTPVTLGIDPQDAEDFWHLTVTDQPVRVSRERADCDCLVRGTASDIYFALWNRTDASAIRIDGDRAVFDLFRSRIAIRWT